MTILVNGVPIGQAILRPKNGNGKEEEEERAEYTLNISTQDAEKVQRTYVGADDEDFIWVYAQVSCNKPEINTASITRAMVFTKEGPDAPWVVLGEPRMVQGYKVVAVKSRPPFPDAELTSEQATVAVSATIEGEQIRGPVDISIYLYRVVFV